MPQVGMSDEAKKEVVRLFRKKRHGRPWGAVRIARQLSDWPDAPSVRAVGRYLEKIRGWSEAELRRYDEVAWPDSFGTSDLPYASAAAILELTRALGRPPLEPLARWYWRTLQAFPSASVATLHNIAAQLALFEDNDAARQAIGARAVAGELGEIGGLGPFDADKPEDIDRAIQRLEIYMGALTPFFRQGLRELLEGRVKGTWFAEKGGQDESQR